MLRPPANVLTPQFELAQATSPLFSVRSRELQAGATRREVAHASRR
jgi:hypothetical protein